MQFCKDEKINTLYVRIDDYVDIAEIKEKNLKKGKKNQYDNAVRRFLGVASKYGIKIHALAGHPSWANPRLSYIPNLLVDYVIEFNENSLNSVKFEGIQFDIEFYNKENFDNSKNATIFEYLELMNELTNKVNYYNAKSNSPLRLGLAIPYWFDRSDYRIVWNGKNKPLAYHLIDTLDRLQGSYLAIMAYRDTQWGDNGSINITRQEIDYAQNNARNVSFLVGQEVSKVSEKRVSFFNKGKSSFKWAVIDIISDLKRYQTFKGVAIHQLIAYKNL